MTLLLKEYCLIVVGGVASSEEEETGESKLVFGVGVGGEGIGILDLPMLLSC